MAVVHKFLEDKGIDLKGIDAIVGRGGGSIEDLWAFNEERVVRAVYACSVPVVSAVGHETDFTLCDFVSDLRAPTPSAAAELVTPDMMTEQQRIYDLQNAVYALVAEKIADEKHRLQLLKQARSFSSPQHFFDSEKQTVDTLHSRLRLAYDRYLTRCDKRLRADAAKLDSLSPLKVLSRGYSVVYRGDEIPGSVSALQKDDKIRVVMHDGELHCRVEKTVNR